MAVDVKTVFDMGVATTLIVGGGITAYRAIHEMRENRRQRAGELRWKRAAAARELLHEIHVHPLASSAVTMMDWSGAAHEYDLDDGRRLRIAYEDVLTTLAKSPRDCYEKHDAYIRDAFDWLFYFLSRIEHAIRTDHIEFVDVESVFRPYARRVNSDWPSYAVFLDEREHDLAKAFFKRYDGKAENPG